MKSIIFQVLKQRFTFATLTTLSRVGEGKYFVMMSAKKRLKRERQTTTKSKMHQPSVK